MGWFASPIGSMKTRFTNVSQRANLRDISVHTLSNIYDPVGSERGADVTLEQLS